MTWLTEHWGVIVSVAFGLSETLALIPQVKSNSVFQLVSNLLSAMKNPGAPK